MVVRALSLTQPWANLVAQGRKTIETRTWATPYRGWLLVCATREHGAGAAPSAEENAAPLFTETPADD
jgi:hypothetical protein